MAHYETECSIFQSWPRAPSIRMVTSSFGIRRQSTKLPSSYRIPRASTLSYSPKDRDGMALSGAYSLTAEIQSIAISNGDFCFMCQSCAHGKTGLCHHMMFIFQRSMHLRRIVFMYVVLYIVQNGLQTLLGTSNHCERCKI